MTLFHSLKRFKVDKLIRDKLPSLMRKKGIQVYERIMEKEEFIARLKDKLIEEAKEVENAQTKQELIEELADVLEVFYTLVQANDLVVEDIEKARLAKKEAKGGFEARLYNRFVEIPENDPSIDYYLAKPDHYPQMVYQGQCLFCQIAKGDKPADIVATFEHCFVLKDQFPVSKGHLLIIPHHHTLNWFTAPEEVRLEIVYVLTAMKAKLDLEYRPDGYNIGANCGEMAGQSVMHLHVHLIPRYKGDMQDPKGGVRGVIPEKQKY